MKGRRKKTTSKLCFRREYLDAPQVLGNNWHGCDDEEKGMIQSAEKRSTIIITIIDVPQSARSGFWFTIDGGFLVWAAPSDQRAFWFLFGFLSSLSSHSVYRWWTAHGGKSKYGLVSLGKGRF